MPTLSTEQLVRGLQTGKPATPWTDERLLDDYIEKVRMQEIELQTENTDRKHLDDHVREMLYAFVHPGAVVALDQCETYVLPFPLCLAYSQKIADRKIIVIGQGLIDLIANTTLSAALIDQLPPELDDYHFLDIWRNIPAKQVFSNALFALHAHFYKSAAPLPNLLSVVPSEIVASIRFGIDGALLFILLHELGHHLLRHINDDEPRHERYAGPLKDAPPRHEAEEMEADRFIFDCLYKEHRALSTQLMAPALAFFTRLEVISGQRSDSHPLALVRNISSSIHMHSLLKTPSYERWINPSDDRGFIVVQHLPAHDGGRFLKAPRRDSLRVLTTMNDVLKHCGMDIRAIWTEPHASWLHFTPKLPLN